MNSIQKFLVVRRTTVRGAGGPTYGPAKLLQTARVPQFRKGMAADGRSIVRVRLRILRVVVTRPAGPQGNRIPLELALGVRA